MNKDKVIDALAKARELLAHGWIKGRWSVDESNKSVDPWDESACKWCIEGAVLAASHFDEEAKPLAEVCMRFLQAANTEFTNPSTLNKIIRNQQAGKIAGSQVPQVNDRPMTTQEQIIRMFDNSIKLARAARWDK